MSSPRLPLGRKKYPRILPAPEPGGRGGPDEEGGQRRGAGALPPKRQRRAGRFACDACRSKKSAVWLFYFVPLAHHWRNSLRPSGSGPPEVAAPWHAIVPAHLNGDTCLHIHTSMEAPLPPRHARAQERLGGRGGHREERCHGVTLQSVSLSACQPVSQTTSTPSPSCRGGLSAHPPIHTCHHHPFTHLYTHHRSAAASSCLARRHCHPRPDLQKTGPGERCKMAGRILL